MISRKNTSKIIAEWKDFLNGSLSLNERRNLNESPRDIRDENEVLKALVGFYQDKGMSQTQISDFEAASEFMDIETLRAMLDAIEIEESKEDVLDDESEQWMADSEDNEESFIEREPLEADEDLGM